MASSSWSQESVDISDDYELDARRTRVRTHRARGVLPRTGDRDSETSSEVGDLNGDSEHVESSSAQTQLGTNSGATNLVHETPTKLSAVQRAKDKRTRPNHLQKGKLPKDKRKLREKRRSTGVVHLANTESTGDSLDDDDDDVEEGRVLTEAKRNTTYNEVIDADNPQTPSEVRARIQQFQSFAASGAKSSPENPTKLTSPTNVVGPRGFVSGRNKSPSDLEADLEDNQDYDSGVSQSYNSVSLNSKSSDRKLPWTIQSKFVSEVTQSFKPAVSQSKPGTSQVEKSVLSPSTFQSKLKENEKDQLSQNLSSLPRKSISFGSNVTTSNETMRQNIIASYEAVKSNTTTTLHESLRPNVAVTHEPVGSNVTVAHEPVRPVASVLSRYQIHDKKEEPLGYRSRFRDSEVGRVRGPLAQTYTSSLMNKDDDAGKRKLEKDLDRERDENKRLQKVLEEKDRRIAELERQVAMLNRDVEDLLEDMENVQIENRALIQAVGQLSTSGSNV